MQRFIQMPTFRLLAPDAPSHPVVIGVPHAGQNYPVDDLARSIVPPDVLSQLEDRHADLLVEPLAALGGTIVIATHARAWLDLNRSPREIDPGIAEGPLPRDIEITPRVRAGLGLLPRRLANGRQIWRGPLPVTEIMARVAAHHQPYHEALRAGLARARARFGAAVLLDCHSMPPLRQESGGHPVDVVIGDRHGGSADPRLSDRLVGVARDHGYLAVRNEPYAGGYTTQHHGKPRERIHAIQIEIDRRLYLDPMMDQPGPGLARIRAMIRDMVAMLGDVAGDTASRLAAE